MSGTGLMVVCAVSLQPQQAVSEDYVRAPSALVHKTCSFQVPSGTRVVDKGDEGAELEFPDGSSKSVPRCKFPITVFDHNRDFSETNPESSNEGVDSTVVNSISLPPQGWQVYTYYVAQNNVSSFVGNWNVPDIPSDSSGQLLYVFTGLQNNCGGFGKCGHGLTNPVGILQPVMQYGDSPAGGGDFWGMASWYVGAFGTANTQVSKVSPQDLLLGNMTRLQGEEWEVDFTDVTNPHVAAATLRVSKPSTKFEPDCYVTMETYGVSSCKQYPKTSVMFVSMVIKELQAQITPKWVRTNYSSACGETSVVVSPSAVTLVW